MSEQQGNGESLNREYLGDDIKYAYGPEVEQDLSALHSFFASRQTNVLPLALLQKEFAPERNLTVLEFATTLNVGFDRGLLRRRGLTPEVELFTDTAKWNSMLPTLDSTIVADEN